MEFKFNIDGTDEIFDEKSNTILAIRNVSWGDNPARLELRKWYISSDGGETPNKGFSFLTEDGPNELVNKMIELGYGKTKDILERISKRDDYTDVVYFLRDGKELEEYYDPRDIFNTSEEE